MSGKKKIGGNRGNNKKGVKTGAKKKPKPKGLLPEPSDEEFKRILRNLRDVGIP